MKNVTYKDVLIINKKGFDVYKSPAKGPYSYLVLEDFEGTQHYIKALDKKVFSIFFNIKQYGFSIFRISPSDTYYNFKYRYDSRDNYQKYFSALRDSPTEIVHEFKLKYPELFI